jgi:CelD/BcsL family acetyltransferase involved in cellulose biosynthesis
MKIINHPSFELWEQVVSKSAYSTFFHTPTWAQVIVETFPEFRICTKGFVLDDGTVAIVPMVSTIERNRYFRWCESMFPGGYGGVVAARELAQAELDSISRCLTTAQTAYIHVMGNPFVSHELAPIFSRTVLSTHMVDLTEGFETLFSRYTKSKKKDTRKAQKLGVEISIAESEDEFRAYYQVYEDTLRRWGDQTLIVYPYRLFERICHHRSDEIALWAAKFKGNIVAGALNFYKNGCVIGWHTATCERFLKYRLFPLLLTEMIRDACNRGFNYFDFGPSGGLKGVEDYKEEFGARRVYFNSYVWQDNKLYHVYQKLLHRGKGPPTQSLASDIDEIAQEATLATPEVNFNSRQMRV